ncbi:MAG: NADH-quinone oxidoreductase subunit C [Clostridia bacterium]
MNAEQIVIDRFCERFPFLTDRIYITRPKRIFTTALTRNEFEQIVRFAKYEAGFTRMHNLVGTDDGDDIGFLYMLSNDEHIMLTLRETAPKSDPWVNSMVQLFPCVLWHERELVDLFGADVRALPDGPTYPLPDGWPKGNYPMRKDWDVTRFNKDTMTYTPASADKEATDE